MATTKVAKPEGTAKSAGSGTKKSTSTVRGRKADTKLEELQNDVKGSGLNEDALREVPGVDDTSGLRQEEREGGEGLPPKRKGGVCVS